MDEKDLKIQALIERVAELTAAYEDKVADLRVALTVQAKQLEENNKETPGDELVSQDGRPLPATES